MRWVVHHKDWASLVLIMEEACQPVGNTQATAKA
jgi:hypothetical protein